MSKIYHELLALIKDVATVTSLPVIKSLILPSSTQPARDKYAKFGLLSLEDDSAGFFYRLLDLPSWAAHDASGRLEQLQHDITGQSPADTAQLMLSDDLLSRGVGIAAGNAVAHHAFKLSGWLQQLEQPPPVPTQAPSGAVHVGMVGYFGPIVRRLEQQKTRLTVLELDETLYQSTPLLVVTGDATALRDCDQVICTASTLLNDTLDDLLEKIGTAPFFELVGPTCGCFPDPLFKRGVNQIGGSTVVHAASARDRVAALQPWGDSVKKYTCTPENYPGIDWFLSRLSNT